MKKYIIENMNGSGSGCDTIFDTIEDAQRHMSFYTDKEREGLEIIPIEVGFLVYVEGSSKGTRYIWDASDIEDGGLCDCPNGEDDLFDSIEEAEAVKEEAEAYIEDHDYQLSVGIEQIVK